MILLDVTLRDGGFTNDFRLPLVDARKVISILNRVRMDIIEIGYLTSLPSSHGVFNEAGVCLAWPTDLIAEVVSETTSKIAAMLHLESGLKFDCKDIAASGIHLIRIPVSAGSSSPWRRTCEKLVSLGVNVSINATCGSWLRQEEISSLAKEAVESGATMFFVADTNGALLPSNVAKIFQCLSDEIKIDLGFHAHDFKRLALANVFAAVEGGAKIIDCSIAGLGRSLGNACTEVLQEMAGKSLNARSQLLKEVPSVLKMFGRAEDDENWARTTAFLDFMPPQIEVLERFSKYSSSNKFQLAAALLQSRSTLPTNPNAFVKYLQDQHLEEKIVVNF